MKIRICDRCQFRTLEIRKICRTCGGMEFTAYDASGVSENSEAATEAPRDWKSALLTLWKSSVPRFDSE